jgi:hypothetical protein
MILNFKCISEISSLSKSSILSISPKFSFKHVSGAERAQKAGISLQKQFFQRFFESDSRFLAFFPSLWTFSAGL